MVLKEEEAPVIPEKEEMPGRVCRPTCYFANPVSKILSFFLLSTLDQDKDIHNKVESASQYVTSTN